MQRTFGSLALASHQSHLLAILSSRRTSERRKEEQKRLIRGERLFYQRLSGKESYPLPNRVQIVQTEAEYSVWLGGSGRSWNELRISPENAKLDADNVLIPALIGE